MRLKILYVGTVQGMNNIGKFYLFPQRLVNGFNRLGHNVYLFNDREMARAVSVFHSSRLGRKKMNKNLIKLAKSFAPDLVVLGDCKNVLNETLEEIRHALPEIKIINRNVDALDCPKKCSRLLARAPYVDATFSTTAGDILKSFASSNSFSAFFPNPVDPSIDTGTPHTQKSPDIDLFFAGALMKRDDQRSIFIQKLLESMGSDVKSKIIGGGINDEKLFGHKFIEALSNSAMGLSLNKTDIPVNGNQPEDYYLYASDRMSQYMGNGLLTFCHKTPQYSDLFSKDEIVEFEAPEELAEKVVYFKNNPEERQKIAQSGYEKSRAMLDCSRIAQYMIDLTFDQPHSHEYEWPTEKYTANLEPAKIHTK